MKIIIQIAILSFLLVGCNGSRVKQESSIGIATNDLKIEEDKTEEYNINSNVDFKETLELLQGQWVHRDDSLAIVDISDDTWTFGYIGEEEGPSDVHKIILTDNLPNSKDNHYAGEFLLLVNGKDTLQYELMGVTDSVFSQMYLPRGNMHVYLRRRTKSKSL